MGMFDRIVLDKEVFLPLPEEMHKFQRLEYQTKSLDCTLSTYLINADGYLYLTNRDYESDDLIEEKERIDYHGIINFGAYEATDLIDYSVDFEAKFTDGVLQNIKLIKFKTFEHESKKKQQEKFREKSRIEENKITSKVYRLLDKFIFSPIFKFFGLPNARLSFSCPNLVLFYKPTHRDKNYGLYFDEISTGICLKKNKFVTNFSCKFLGFGFVYNNFKPNFGDVYS